jgi:hypothetical protein
MATYPTGDANDRGVFFSNFRSPIEQAKIRERTHEPLSATDGIAEPIFRHRRLPTGRRLLLAGGATQARR